jgi:hypothetical protein
VVAQPFNLAFKAAFLVRGNPFENGDAVAEHLHFVAKPHCFDILGRVGPVVARAVLGLEDACMAVMATMITTISNGFMP